MAVLKAKYTSHMMDLHKQKKQEVMIPTQLSYDVKSTFLTWIFMQLKWQYTHKKKNHNHSLYGT